MARPSSEVTREAAMKIRVMLAEDHRMVREVIGKILGAESDIEIVGETSSGVETLSTLGEVTPDVLVLDIGLPDINGIEIAHQIAKRYPTVRILALSGHSETIYIEEMLKAGARGYVVKSAGLSELISAVRVVAGGGCYVSPEVSRALVGRIQSDRGAAAPPNVLGKRETEVLRLVACGKRSAEIAHHLGIAVATVEVHRRNIMRKLDIHSTADLTRYAIHEGLIPSSPELDEPVLGYPTAGDNATGRMRPSPTIL